MGVSHHRFHLEIFFLCICARPLPLYYAFFDIHDGVEDWVWCRQALRKLELMWKPPIGTWHTIIPKKTRFLILMTYQWQKHNNGQIALIHLFTCSAKSVFDWTLQWGYIIDLRISLRWFLTFMEPFLVSDSLPLRRIVLEDRNWAHLQ